MATETLLKVRLLNASKTHAEWTSADPVLKKGEIAYSSDKKQIRVGDGSSKWSQLSYIDADHIVGFSNSGSTITYTKADGSTGTITLPEYDIATSSTPGLVKSGGNITVASDGTVTVNTATKANQVSGTAGSVNADRHVWFSDSVTETVRNYDDDFKYNPNTNTLKVTKIDGVELTGTPKAPTAASGTNSTQIATTAFVQNAVGNAEIGGRNLVKDSHKAVSNSSYATADYYFGDDPPLDGEEVTIQIKGQLADTKSYWNLYNSGGSINCFAVEKERYDATTGIYTDTGTWRVGTSSNTFMRIYAFTSSQSGTSTIEWVKLERGNKPTDWTPAPEDLVSDITLSGTTLSYKNPVGTQLGSYTLSKANVGLGNVDNTSDANKPISTATQNALDQLSAKVGNAKQFTGTCSSAADATAKVVTCTAFTADDLVKGTRISVYFDNTNTGAVGSLTLNVNSTGAKSIKYIYNGSYNNIPGAGYIKAGQIYNFTYDGTYWVVDMMYNTDTIPNHLRYYNNTYAKKAIAANKWIVGNKDGYEEVASGVTFDLSYPILYTSGAVSQGSSNYINMFSQFYDLNLTNLKSGFSSSAKKMIYLVVTVSGNIATVDPTIITDTLPTTDDGKVYITLGRLGAQSTGANYFLFQPIHPMFIYKKGAIRAYSGSADVVNGHTVESDVPSGAVFTDKYVAQKISTTDNNYPLLLSDQTNAITTDETIGRALRNNSIYANPKTGLLKTNTVSMKYGRMGNTCYNICQGMISGTAVETILYTGIKWQSSAHMPVVHITGFAYGSNSPVEFKIGFYIYSDKIGYCGAQNMGAWNPDIYLFKYTNNEVDYVAVGLKGSCYFLQLSVNVQDEMGTFNNILFDSGLWSWSFLTTEGNIPAADNGVTCVQVPYKINYNPKPTLTIQGDSSTIGTYDGTNTATINITKSSIGLGNVENKSSATIRGELTASNVTTALGYTPVKKAGDTMTGDLILQTSSGNSPAIIFQRGTYTDTLNDWEIRVKNGVLFFGQRGSGSTAFDTSIYLDNSGGIHATTFTGNVTGNATTSNATYELRQDSQYTYSNRRTSANIDSTNNGGLRTLLATSSMSAANGKPDYDAHIIHLDWDNSSTYSAQLAVGNKGVNGRIASRAQNADKTWTTWAYVYDTLHKPTASEVGALPLSGGTMTGPIKWTNSTALPQATSASYVVTIDAFADGGTQKWIYTSNLNVGSATTASYLTSNTSFDYANTGLSWFDIQGTAGAAVQANDTPTTAWWHVLRFNHQNSNPYYTDLAIPFNHPSIYYKRINNGTVSGNKWVKVLDEDNYSTYAIPLTQKGAASGVATLDTNTKVPIAQLPEVTTTTAGIMTAADKVKLNGIATNLVDGSAIGSLRGIYTTTESDTYTIGQYATALGNGTKASGNYSFAEGYGTTASGDISHVEGSSGTASGGVSHAEGFGTTSSGEYSHAEGYETVASGFYSHSQNYHTIAASSSQTALGKYNQSDANNVYAIILGNGTADNARSNALTIDWDGNLKTNGYLAGRNALYTLVSNPKGNDPESSIYTEYKIADSISDSETNYYGVFGTSISSNNVQTYMRAYKNVADSSDYIGFWLISPPSGESEAWLNAHNFHIGKKMYITGPTAESNAFDSDNPRLEFQNGGATQNLALVYTDYDSVQAPSSLTLIGNQGGEYFIAPNIKATGSFYGNLSGNATTASYLQGLSSRSTSAGWGNQNGTVLSCYSTSGGGGWVLRQNGGQMNMIIDGFYYQNEGNNLVLDTANYTSYVSKVRDIGNGTATTFKYSASGLNYADYTWLAGWNGYELRAVNKSQFLASTGGTLSGGLTVLKSSGESQIIASNGTNKLYIYANSDGRVGIYYNTANGSSGSIISRPNNSNVITLGNSKGGVLTYSYNYTSAPPVVSNTTNKNRVSHLAGHSSYMAVVLQLDATDYSNRTITLSGSDIRLKDNIKDPDLDALPVINSIQMHSFDWKDAHEYTHQPLGMVADELEKIDPRFAVGGGYDEDGIMCVKSVDTFYLVGYLVKAVQELSAEVDRLKNKQQTEAT